MIGSDSSTTNYPGKVESGPDVPSDDSSANHHSSKFCQRPVVQILSFRSCHILQRLRPGYDKYLLSWIEELGLSTSS